MKVVFDEEAIADLDRIHAWIAKDSPRNAAAVMARIFESIERLADFPRMGRAGRFRGTYEWIIPDLRYIVVFELHPDRDELLVTAVFHGAQNR